jgi:hypothetical protein
MLKRFFKKMFEPKSQKQIRNKTTRIKHQMNTQIALRKRKHVINGRASLGGLTLNSNKMNFKTLENLLQYSNLSINKDPNYAILNGKVMFTVPFATLGKFNAAKTYLNFIKNKEGDNRGQFKDIKIDMVRKLNTNNSTLMFTLSSSGNINIPLPKEFVEKIFGVDVPINKKRKKITKEDLIKWSKYQRIRKGVKKGVKSWSVKDLFKADKTLNDDKMDKIYKLWEKYGDVIAKHVENIRSIPDPKHIPTILGRNSTEEDILVYYLKQAMSQYLAHERNVFQDKSLVDVKPLFLKYRNNLKDIDSLLPRFCNIPLYWRAECVHNTMRDEDPPKKEDETYHTFQEKNKLKNGNNHGNYAKNYTKLNNKKKFNYNVLVNDTPAVEQYRQLLLRYRPYLYQLFHTIGSIRYPHTKEESCPLTQNSTVWKYTLNEKKRNKPNNQEQYDSWIKLLSDRRGFSQGLQNAHQQVDQTLSRLVDLNKSSVNKFNSDPFESAWNLYEKCIKCKLHEHPMFRVCAGFKVMTVKGEFMDIFRYMVHNRPNSKNDAQGDSIEYRLTEQDVKYFFLSSDSYRENSTNNRLNINTRRFTGTSSLVINTKNKMEGCGNFMTKELAEKLEKSNQDGTRMVLAWPTLKEAWDYYN